MLLYKTAIASVFGKNSPRPFRLGVIRIGVLLSIALFFGTLFAMKIPPLPFTHMTLPHLFYIIVFICQLAALVTLLASYGMLRSYQKNGLTRLLLILPVQRMSTWAITILPGIVICLLTAALVGPPILSLALKAGMPSLLLLIAAVTGNISALGLVYGFRARFVIFSLLAIGAMCAAEYKLLTYYYSPTSSVLSERNDIFLSLLLLFSILLLLNSIFHLGREAAGSYRSSMVYTAKLPTFLWFGKKMVRVRSLKLNILITLLMSCLIVVLSKKIVFVDVDHLGITGALLGAALAADIRTISRRSKPAEICGIRGSLFFIKSQTVWGICCVLVAVSPLIITAYASVPFLEAAIACLIPIFLGIAAGLFTGTTIAPGPRDITAQCGATLLAIAILLLPWLPLLKNANNMHGLFLKIGLVLVLIASCLIIEYRRNPYYWKGNHERI